MFNRLLKKNSLILIAFRSYRTRRHEIHYKSTKTSVFSFETLNSFNHLIICWGRVPRPDLRQNFCDLSPYCECLTLEPTQLWSAISSSDPILLI